MFSSEKGWYKIFWCLLVPLFCDNIQTGKIYKGQNYIMITYVSKENNLEPDDKIRYIWGLNCPIFIL